MARPVLLALFLLLALVQSAALALWSAAADDLRDLADAAPLMADAPANSTIREWHFHTYWITGNARLSAQAEQLRAKLLAAVRSRQLVAVFPGVTADEFPRLDVGKVPRFNTQPIGPHISGSFETWVPAESVAQALSFFTLNRGDLTILVHPLTQYEVEDHTTRAVFLGKPFPLDVEKLRTFIDHVPLQYPELGLGYSAPNNA